jgi:signal transduction histidine kinase
MGLRLRLILVLAIPLVLVVGVYGLWRIRIERAELLAETERNLALTAKAIQIAVENALRDRQIGDVRQLLAEIVSGQEQIDRIRVFDSKFQPVIVSNPLAIGEEVPAPALARVMTTGEPEVFYQLRGTQPVLYYIAPLRPRKGAVQGTLEMVQLATTVHARASAATWDVGIRLSLLILSVALVGGLILQTYVLRPLFRLTEGIQRLGRGDPAPPLPVGRRDELGRVAQAFNTMTAQLDHARRQLVEETERALDLERQLRHAQTVAVAGRLATALAHEVGTPLNIISGRAEFLLQTLPAGDRHREELEVIIAQIDRISAIIRTLLDTVRPAKPDMRPTALRPVVDRVLPLLVYAARRTHVHIDAVVPDDLPLIVADPAQLQQVLINLTMNAIEAMPDGGEVDIRAERRFDDGRLVVLLTVHDTGSGMDAEHAARVFEPFVTTKPPGAGTGLGLTICRDIVKAHGGSIAVESQPGKGTTFRVTLPAIDGGVA